jgi:hypothetical protein
MITEFPVVFVHATSRRQHFREYRSVLSRQLLLPQIGLADRQSLTPRACS